VQAGAAVPLCCRAAVPSAPTSSLVTGKYLSPLLLNLLLLCDWEMVSVHFVQGHPAVLLLYTALIRPYCEHVMQGYLSCGIVAAMSCSISYCDDLVMSVYEWFEKQYY
jgi:hypothetical protein